MPKLFNLRTDPYERADDDVEHLLRLVLQNALHRLRGADHHRRAFLQTFAEFPPRQKAASFTIDQAMEKLEAMLTSGH